MRIVRFSAAGEPRYGLLDGDGLDEVVVISGDPLLTAPVATGERLALASVRLLAPVIPRSKVVGVGKNYAAHVSEMGGSTPPAEPLLFLKPNTAVVGPADFVTLPWQSTEVHYEGELGVVIGRICRDVPLERVPEVVFGYTCGNDVTARDLQRSDGQWSRAKGFDTFCPLGPWIVTADTLAEEGLDPEDLAIETRLDGKTVQRARTSDLIHSVAACVSAASEAFTLLPGDVVLTGTPAGVGPLSDGQVVEVEIEGLGILSNPVRDSGGGRPA